MAKETYIKARARLLSELAAKNYPTKPALKVPQVAFDSDQGHTIFFHTQAVYLDAHSTFIDIRGMTCEAFLEEVGRVLAIRERVR